MEENFPKSIQIFGGHYSPYSTDPMDYDDVVHHFAWTSVLGTLVTNYKVGEITPQIAEGWQTNSDFTEWSFRISQQCYFENGDSITPEIVAISLKRAALLQYRANSHSGITEDLVGIETLKDVKGHIDGVRVDGNLVILRFTKPNRDLLTKIGFGLYSIVHPSQFNGHGQWLDKNKIISSGPYKVKSWEKDKLTLVLNPKNLSCYQLPEKPLRELEIVFGENNIDFQKQLMATGSSKSLMFDKTFEYLGIADSDILYIRVYKKIDLETQQVLRDVLLEEFASLHNINFSINRSFLPLSIKGIEGVPKQALTQKQLKLLEGVHLRVPLFEESPKAEVNKSFLSLSDAFNVVMNVLESKYKVKIQRINFETTPINISSTYDLMLMFTGIILENPYGDISFMFKSKEGIQLPDRDGTIWPLLENVEKNISQINKKLWDQSLIVPITHYSSGLWIKKDVFNTKGLNNILPATNFQFIGFK